METTLAMKRIGILGGSSDQATADYYRRLNKAVNDRLGGWNTAELVIVSMNFAFSADCVRHGKWDEMAAYLADRAVALERAGAEILICVSNTLHRVADRFTAGIEIPFLHIVDPTAAAIRAAGLGRVALLGTKPVMATDHLIGRYRRFGLDILVPPPEEQDLVDRIIFDELCRGQFTAQSKAAYLDIVDGLRARGAQGVILGCTEIPLLIEQADRPALPMFDTTGLHVDAVVDMALAE
ncbi:MAG TPA: aspartate/glutamate racemase family protein [Aliidongia sp.]|nr:aspartate/glutamate racemase family protein [Aliidongia sp.]